MSGTKRLVPELAQPIHSLHQNQSRRDNFTEHLWYRAASHYNNSLMQIYDDYNTYLCICYYTTQKYHTSTNTQNSERKTHHHQRYSNRKQQPSARHRLFLDQPQPIQGIFLSYTTNYASQQQNYWAFEQSSTRNHHNPGFY